MDHSHGFKFDFPQLVSRRHAIGLIGAAGLATAPGSAIAAQCVADAPETAGPYPADGSRGRGGKSPNVLAESGVLREDMRPSFAGLNGEAEGVETRFELELVNVTDGCAPLAGFAIYAWHCDAIGRYSLYDIEDQNFLRGVAVTDAMGKARFTSIFPGCYSARYPHVHFEIFTSTDAMGSGRDSLLVSQFAFEQSDCEAVYSADPAYSNGIRNLRRNRFDRDMVFRDDTAAQNAQRMMRIVKAPDGVLSGKVRIGIVA